MKKISIALVVFGMAIIPILNVEPATAQTGSNIFTYLSATGSDSGTCVTSPCRTLTYALTQTLPGGHVRVSSLTGAWESINENVTITGSVHIAGSIFPSVLGATTGTALTINAGINDKIAIHDMDITNYGSATNGIVFNSGGSLVLQHGEVSGFSNVGVTFSPNTSGGISRFGMFRDARVTNNANGNILLSPVGSTNVLANIKDSIIAVSQNGYGFKIDTTAGVAQVRAEIIDTWITSVGANGIAALAPTSTGQVFATGVHISDVTYYGALANGANATIVLNNTSIIRSLLGVGSNAGGIVASFGNNAITLNANNNTGILTPVAPH